MIVSQLVSKTVWRCKTTGDHDIGSVPVIDEADAVIGVVPDPRLPQVEGARSSA